MVLDKAKELGMALLESKEYEAMQLTQAAFEADAPLCKVMQEYQDKQRELLETLQKEGEMDRLLVAALSRDVETLQGQLMENLIFSAAMRAQEEFSELMRAVNAEISACIGIAAPDSSASCGGGCSSCAGCQH